MKNFRITATAPTTYQYRSLTHFGMHIISNGNGSHTAEQEFDTEEEAKEFLIERCNRYFENEDELLEAISDVEKYGMVRLDAVSGSIVENEVE